MTTNTKTEAVLQQALYALENGKKVRGFEGGTRLQIPLENDAIFALREAIKQLSKVTI